METKRIGNKIAEARKKASISQAQLAEQLFISAQAVGKWERGESMPDIITFTRMAEILGVDLNYFSESFKSVVGETAFKSADTFGNTETVHDNANHSHSQEQQVLTNFSGSNLPESDFADVTAHKGKFEGSALRSSNFSGSDLSGSSFRASDAHDANFDGANLTDCSFSVVDLLGASFNKSILVRTNFSVSGQGAKFIDVTLVDVKLTKTDLRKTVFENCIFNGVDFSYCDLRGISLDGHTFTGVSFDNTALKDASFRGATLKNVTFRATHALTNKYYRALKTICFDGAIIDKLTYNALKGMGANLSNATAV